MNGIKLLALGLVCLVALLAVPAVQAQCSTGGQLGPCPALIDTNGNGRPEPGSDQPITFDFVPGTSMATLTINNPWTDSCGGRGNVVTLSQQAVPALRRPNGVLAPPAYDTAMRNASGLMQILSVTGLDSLGAPVGFHFYEYPTGKSGDALLQDDNKDGAYEHLVATSNDLPYFDLSFVGDKGYISVPWAQASLLGMNGDCKLPGGDPQIFLPTVGGRIEIGYPGFLTGPPIFAAPLADPVPSLTECGLLLLVLSLGFAGWRVLRRRHALA